MPCRDYDYGSQNTRTEYIENPLNKKLVERNDELARYLCKVLTDIEKNAPKTYNRLMKQKNLNKWWENHKIEDAKVAEIERLEKRLKELKER